VALAAAAVLVAPWRAGPAARAGRRRLAITVVAAGVVLFGAAQVGRSALAQHYRAQAEDVLPVDPVKAIQKANDSLALNDEALPAYYAKAAAYARLDRYRDSRSVLLEAARREPHDFVTWALLGDLATRRGDLPLARRYYRRASRLNPREPYIRRYTSQPRAVN
jgi:tetratricopeptide (TPR) repeat protein